MSETVYFTYGETETAYLSRRDPLLGIQIQRIGHIFRECDTDPFSSVVHSIVAQQISKKAQITVWKRVEDALGEVTAENLLKLDVNSLQALGMTFRKAEYILDFARKVHTGEFDPEALRDMSDAQAIQSLSSLKGIGVWTAEMQLLFCFQRPDILSYLDLAIVRGLKLLHGLSELDKETFRRYKALYSPYGSVASLYLWAIAGSGTEGIS